MANKITDEVFKKISHEFLYDVSKDAVIRYLNANGHRISNLNDMTDETIGFLWINRLHLYLFAREKGLHDKPVTKFSPDEEGLYEEISIYYESKVVRGINNINSSRAKMYFILKGCNDNTYFYIKQPAKGQIGDYIVQELIEVHIDEVNFNGCIDDMKTSLDFRDNYIIFYDKHLNRYRFFNKTENSTKWCENYGISR